MDKDALRLEFAKAMIEADRSLIGDHSEFAPMWMGDADRLLSALEARGLVVVSAEEHERRADTIMGLEADLDSALDVLWRRGDEGARHWIEMNYPRLGEYYRDRDAQCALEERGYGHA